MLGSAVMKKVFSAPTYHIYERDYSPIDQELLGELSKFIIFPEKNSFVVQNLNNEEDCLEQ